MLTRSGDAEDRRRQKDAKRAEALEKAHAAAQAAGQARFWNSPGGRARSAKRSGQRYFQIELPLSETARTWNSMLFGEVDTQTKHSGGQGAVLTEIEDEGWELFHVGFVFQETGQVSRDKFLSSGQSIQTTGQTFGVYLFRVTEAPLKTDEPWMKVTAGWHPDPLARHDMRYWDGNTWTEHVSNGSVQSTDPIR